MAISDLDVIQQHTILRCVVGSTLHGMAIDGQDDRDELGVCIPPPLRALGFAVFEHCVERTQPEGTRSGPGDVDRITYSLRKYCALAVKGNPTALLPLFCRDRQVLWATAAGEQLQWLAPAFLGRHVGARFLGYLRDQKQGFLGVGRARTQRPELVARYGFDVKYAAHAIRLAYQGIELLRTGTLTLPMPTEQREEALAVRRGEIASPIVAVLLDRLERELEWQADHPSPAMSGQGPDIVRIQRFVVDKYLERWRDLLEA